MLHDQDWIPSVVAVRMIVPTPVDPSVHVRAVYRIYSRLVMNDHGVLGACTGLPITRSEAPIVVVTVYQHGHGYGWAYVDVHSHAVADIIAAGVSERVWAPPMPVTPIPHGSLSLMRDGMVELRHSVWELFGPLGPAVDYSGFARSRPGWELDVAEIVSLAYGEDSPEYAEISWPSALNPEDN